MTTKHNASAPRPVWVAPAAVSVGRAGHMCGARAAIGLLRCYPVLILCPALPTTVPSTATCRLAALLLPLAALLLAACSPAAAAAQRRLLAAAAPAIEGCSDCSPQGYSEPQFRACLRAIQGLPPNSTSVIFPDDGPAAEAARRWGPMLLARCCHPWPDLLLLPGKGWPISQSILAARRTFNSRMLREPAATFYARSAADVAAAVACAQRFGVKVSPAGGRQGLLGGAVQHGYLTIDVSALTKASLKACSAAQLAVR